MRLLFLSLLIALVSGVTSFLLPWWAMGPVAAILAFLLPIPPGKAFLAGFAAIFLYWLFFGLFYDARDDHNLSAKMAAIFPFRGNYLPLLIAGAIIGGLVGGLSALTGRLLRKAFFDPPAPIRART